MTFHEGVFRFADEYLSPYKINESTGQISARYCPICKGGESGDRHTFAINIKTGLNSCRRGTCGWHGTFADLIKEVGAKEGNFMIMEAQANRDYSNAYRLPVSQKNTIHPRSSFFQGRSRSTHTSLDERFQKQRSIITVSPQIITEISYSLSTRMAFSHM